jgi:hypothetical protein
MEVSREGGLQLFDQILPEATLNLTTYTARAAEDSHVCVAVRGWVWVTRHMGLQTCCLMTSVLFACLTYSNTGVSSFIHESSHREACLRLVIVRGV